jgi:hypothetical protein
MVGPADVPLLYVCTEAEIASVIGDWVSNQEIRKEVLTAACNAVEFASR